MRSRFEPKTQSICVDAFWRNPQSKSPSTFGREGFGVRAKSRFITRTTRPL